MENSIASVLAEFMKIGGVSAVALVGRDGFVIESTSHSDVDMDALGAMVATAIGTAESLGQEFNLGSMEQYLSEFSQGKVLMATVHDDILAIFTDTNAVIGGVRYAVKKNMPSMLEAFK